MFLRQPGLAGPRAADDLQPPLLAQDPGHPGLVTGELVDVGLVLLRPRQQRRLPGQLALQDLQQRLQPAPVSGA